MTAIRKRRWMLAIVAIVVVAGVVAFVVLREDPKDDVPRFELTELFESEGKQWAHFRVHAPSHTDVSVQYERLLGTQGRQIGDSFAESNTRQSIILRHGDMVDVPIQAPVLGVWRVRFLFEGPRKGLRLWVDRMALAWRQRRVNFWSVTPNRQVWVLETEAFTNAVPGTADAARP